MVMWETYQRIGERRQRLVKRGLTAEIRDAVIETHKVMLSLPDGVQGRGYVYRPGRPALRVHRMVTGGIAWTRL